MFNWTFKITDYFGEMDAINITVRATTLREARRKAHVAATCKGFDNDALGLAVIATKKV